MTDFVPFKVTRREAEMILRLFGHHVLGDGEFRGLTEAVYSRNIDALESLKTEKPLKFYIGHSRSHNNRPVLVGERDSTSRVTYAEIPQERFDE